MHLYKVDTYDYGVYYRHARSAEAARQRICFAVFGKGYDGYDHEYWDVVLVK